MTHQRDNLMTNHLSIIQDSTYSVFGCANQLENEIDVAVSGGLGSSGFETWANSCRGSGHWRLASLELIHQSVSCGKPFRHNDS
jgi:hypothetical protein